MCLNIVVWADIMWMIGPTAESVGSMIHELSRVIDHLQVAFNNSSLAYVTTKPKDRNHTISFMNPDGSISNMPRVSKLEALGVSISAVGAFDTSVVARIAAVSRAYSAKKTYFKCTVISAAENREQFRQEYLANCLV